MRESKEENMKEERERNQRREEERFFSAIVVHQFERRERAFEDAEGMDRACNGEEWKREQVVAKSRRKNKERKKERKKEKRQEIKKHRERCMKTARERRRGDDHERPYWHRFLPHAESSTIR
jgi:hypothetical protein